MASMATVAPVSCCRGSGRSDVGSDWRSWRPEPPSYAKMRAQGLRVPDRRNPPNDILFELIQEIILPGPEGLFFS
jgi:hypothetical protein